MFLSKLDSTNSSPGDNVQVIAWVEQATAGDYAAFEELYLLYYEDICRYLSALLGSYQDGQDCAQNTFLRAWQELPSLQKACFFKYWLYRIAKNIALNELRRRKLIQWLPLANLVSSSLEERLALPGPEEQVEGQMLLRQLRAQVSPKYWDCFVLQEICGFSQREIAEVLKISKESVSQYVSRGLEQMRKASLRLDNEPTTGGKEH